MTPRQASSTPHCFPYPCIPLGDTAVVIELGQAIDPALQEDVQSLTAWLQSLAWDGIRDIVPAYGTITVHVDPLRLPLSRFIAQLSHAMPQTRQVHANHPHSHSIPVYYGGEAGPDLDEIARYANCSPEEVIQLHCATPYRVYMLGFSPGFPYLGPVPEPIAMPRKSTPRAQVPAGSVGIAGRQTGIYPLASPGGWRLIGRTPTPLFRPGSPTPFLLAPGDLVQFTTITQKEFERLSQEHHADAR